MTIDATMILSVYSFILTLLIGVIGFFLVRTFHELDNKATKEDLKAAEKNIEENSKSISKIKENYLTKDDYFREQAKTEKKLDDIMKLLLDISNNRGGGIL